MTENHDPGAWDKERVRTILAEAVEEATTAIPDAIAKREGTYGLEKDRAETTAISRASGAPGRVEESATVLAARSLSSLTNHDRWPHATDETGHVRYLGAAGSALAMIVA